MGTVAKSSITLSSISDAYSVLMTPNSCVIHADYDGSNPQLERAYTVITVMCGDEKAAMTVDETSVMKSDDEIGVALAKIDDYSWKLSIGSLPLSLLEGSVSVVVQTSVDLNIEAKFTFSVVRESTMLDWIQDWEGGKTKIGDSYVITPKLFVGKKITGDHSSLSDVDGLTGVYIGPANDDSAGVYGYKAGVEIFHLDETGGSIGGWDINEGGIQTDDGTLKILSEGSIVCESEGVLHWALYKDGSGYFAGGNITWDADGNTVFKGEVQTSSGMVGGWYIGEDEIYNTGVGLSSANKYLAIAAITSRPDTGNELDWVKLYGGVAMYYSHSRDYGFIGYRGSTMTFSAGTSNYIAGWTFDNNAIYLGTKNNNAGEYADEGSITIGTNGLRGHCWYIDVDGEVEFVSGYVQFGSTSGKIAGWTFTGKSLYNGTENTTTGEFTTASGDITMSTSGVRGYKWRLESDGTAVFSGGKILFNADGSGQLAGGMVTWATDGSGSLASGNIYWDASGNTVFKGTIGGWKVTENAIYKSTVYLGSDGSVYNNGYWRLNADGSGQLATSMIKWATDGSGSLSGGKIVWNTDGSGSLCGKISWDKDGNITFADSVTAQWQDGINAAQMMAYAQMLYRDPEFSTGFNGTAVYLDGNSYVDFSAGMILATLTAYGLMLRGVGAVTKIDFINSSGSTSTVWSGWTVLNADTPTTIVAASNCSSLTSSYTVRVWFRQSSYDSLTLQVASQTSAQHDSGTYTYYNLYGYDSNSGTSYVDVERALVTDSTAPNSTQKVMKITDYNWFGESDFRLGGFHFANQTRANAKFVVKMVAKIPVGWYIDNAHNAYGTGGKTTWATSKDGTGAYTEYICVVSCGSSGTFSTINHFYLRRQDSDTPVASDTSIVYKDADGTQTTLESLTWYVAYATVYDASSSDKLVTTIDVNGIYTGTLRADQIIAGTIDAENIETDTVDAAIIKNGDAWGLMKDGSGYLANKNITWDADGNLSLTGKITATSGTIAGFTISETGLTNTPFTNDAYIIFRNDTYGTFAGIGGNVLPASSGARGVARFENYSKGNSLWDSYNNYALLVGAQGGYKNCAIYMSGGYVSGLCLKPQSVKADTTLDRGVNVVLCLNTEEITITLPTMQVYDDGYVLLIKNLNGSTVNIKPGQSYHYSTDSAYSSSTSLCSSYIHYDRGSYAKYGKDEQDDLVSDGDATMYVYVRDINVTVDSVTYKGCWVQFKHPRDW